MSTPGKHEPHTDDPHAGLSATGRTADEIGVDDAKPGTDYGASADVGGDDHESAVGAEGGEPRP